MTRSRTISAKAGGTLPGSRTNEPCRELHTLRAERLSGVERTAVSSSVSLFRARPTLRASFGAEAVLVDFGDGEVLAHLAALGVDRGHRRPADASPPRIPLGGLSRAVEAGIRVWAPPYDAELIANATGHWLRRPLDIDHHLREDRFSLLASVPIAGMRFAEYRIDGVGGIERVHAAHAGHTPGSVTHIAEAGRGASLAFTGDLVYGDGMVWSLAATQSPYSWVEGQAATIISCAALAALEPDVLLPLARRADPGSAVAVLLPASRAVSASSHQASHR